MYFLSALRVAVVQKHAFPDLNDNLKHTERMVAEAKNNNANLVVLPVRAIKTKIYAWDQNVRVMRLITAAQR